MKAVAVFLLFVGMFLIIQGYYSQKERCPPPQVQVKYIPRSQYEEQLSPSQKVSQQFKSMFEDVNPWPTVRG
jgi:hypothetical protein